jgi:hypothetical protein
VLKTLNEAHLFLQGFVMFEQRLQSFQHFHFRRNGIVAIGLGMPFDNREPKGLLMLGHQTFQVFPKTTQNYCQ